MIDHGLRLRDASHLRYKFRVTDAASRALRDHDQIPAKRVPLFYLNFDCPTVQSYPQKFRFHCGVVCAVSGYGRVLSCHGPTAER